MLLKLIDKKGMSDVQCYKKANVSKGTFWKINNDPKYKPSKATVLAFAIALELSLDETELLLKTVGLSLSHSNVFDLIIEFYITNGNYDIYEINAALFKYINKLETPYRFVWHIMLPQLCWTDLTNITNLLIFAMQLQ